MKYVKLANTNINVSRIGLGTNAIGGHNLFPNLNEDQGKKIVDKAIKLGINFIDTADMYGKGRSEELIGEVISNFDRSELTIASKAGNQWFDDGSIRRNSDPQYLKRSIENILNRLNTDYLDLFYVHFFDETTPIEYTIASLEQLVCEGKIKAIGVSNLDFKQLLRANSNSTISAVQLPYNLINRNVEDEVLPYCIENNIGFVSYGPLAFGLLAGKYTEEFKLRQGDWRKKLPDFNERFSENITKIQELKKFAASKNITVSNLSMAWILAQNGVTSIIPGAKDTKQLVENTSAININLTPRDLMQINAIMK